MPGIVPIAILLIACGAKEWGRRGLVPFKSSLHFPDNAFSNRAKASRKRGSDTAKHRRI